ncbi:MAG: PAS domain S-box protein [Deltaproteobacteria bacterium]|nr:PAS domain S-box protein [Deltaproteobacteria bacterium]
MSISEGSTEESRTPPSLARAGEDQVTAFADLFPLIFANANEGILLATTDGSIFAANPEACRILGRTEAQVCEAGRTGIFDAGPALSRALAERERTGRLRADLTAIRPDGARIPIEVSSVLLGDSGPPGATVIFFRDVSERATAEEALEAKRQLLDRVFSVLEDAVFVIDYRSGLVIRANSAAEEMFGIPMDELVGHDTSFAHADPERHAAYRRLAEEAWGKGGAFAGETVMRRANGQFFPVRHFSRPVREGDLSVVVEVVRDLSEQKRAAADRARLESALLQAQKMESLSALAGGLALDFNNLMGVVLANAGNVAAQMAEGSPARQALDDIAAAARQGSALGRQVLAYAGRARVASAPLDLAHVVDDVLHLVRASVPKKVAVDLRCAERAPLVGDRGQLGQVLLNLVQNAGEAIGDREGRIAISTGVEVCEPGHPALAWQEPPLEPGPYAWLEVADDGPGMSQEVADRAFDPFFSTRAVGRGLGLAAVSGVVRGHRGAVEVDTAPGRGCRIRIWLPVGGPVEEARREQARPAPAEGGRGTVLVVDDEPLVRRVARRILETGGFHVIEASDGLEASERFRDDPGSIDLVLLDFDMPRMNGAEALDALQLVDPAVRVLLSTGFGDERWMQLFRGKKLSGVIEKPYAAAALLSAVKGAMPGRARAS